MKVLGNLDFIASLFATQTIILAILSIIFFMCFCAFNRDYVKYWLFSLIALSCY